MSAWRFRRCPSCRRVYRAGELVSLDYGARWGHQQAARRQCPGCGYVGPTSVFAVVRERHPEPSRAEVA